MMEVKERRRVSTHDLFPIIEELLKTNKKVVFTISGVSMMPFLINNRDSVLLKKDRFDSLKKGSIILFQLSGGKYILHRIYKLQTGGYRTIGDNCFIEDGFVPYEAIVGVVDKIYKPDREISCDSLWWKGFSWIWIHTIPIRRYMMAMILGAWKIKHELINKT